MRAGVLLKHFEVISMTIQSVDYVGKSPKILYTLIINNCEKVRNTYPCMQIKDYMELSIEECNDIVDRLITFSNNVERIEASHK